MNYRLITITYILLHLVFIVRSQERMTPALAMQNSLKIVETYVILLDCILPFPNIIDFYDDVRCKAFFLAQE